MSRDVSKASSHRITIMPLRLLGVLCLLWLFWNFDMRAVALDWLSLGVPVLAGALLLSVIVFFLKYARWTMLLRLSRIRLPFGRGLALFSSGLFWGLVSPGRLGEFSRCAALERTAGIPMERTAALIVSDRIFDLMVIVGAFVVALSCVSGSGAAAWFVLSLFAAGVFLLRRPVTRMFKACLDRIGISLGLGSGFLIFRETWSCSFGRGGVPAFGLSVASIAALALQGYLIANSGFGLAVSPMQSLFIVTVIDIGSLLPLSIFGFGTNEVMVLGLIWCLARTLPARELDCLFAQSDRSQFSRVCDPERCGSRAAEARGRGPKIAHYSGFNRRTGRRALRPRQEGEEHEGSAHQPADGIYHP